MLISPLCESGLTEEMTLPSWHVYSDVWTSATLKPMVRLGEKDREGMNNSLFLSSSPVQMSQKWDWKIETTKKVREIKLTRKGKDKREQNTWLILIRKEKKIFIDFLEDFTIDWMFVLRDSER